MVLRDTVWYCVVLGETCKTDIVRSEQNNERCDHQYMPSPVLLRWPPACVDAYFAQDYNLPFMVVLSSTRI